MFGLYLHSNTGCFVYVAMIVWQTHNIWYGLSSACPGQQRGLKAGIFDWPGFFILYAVGEVCCCGIWGPDSLEFSILNLNDQGEKLVLIGEIQVGRKPYRADNGHHIGGLQSMQEIVCFKGGGSL